jgi:dipeptidase
MNSFNQPANFFKKDYPENGSESPTDPENKKSGAMEESFRDKFNKQKVFTVNSEEFFWAEGNVLTSQGRGVLSDMAAFLNLRKGKIVLSENSLSAVSVNNIDRSWVIMQYLASEGVNQNRFSLSTNTTLSTAERVEKSDRIVEIVLLESELSR